MSVLTYPRESVYGDGIARHVRTIYGDPIYRDGGPYLDTLGPFVGHDAYGVPIQDAHPKGPHPIGPDGRCRFCHVSESELWDRGASISGWDA